MRGLRVSAPGRPTRLPLDPEAAVAASRAWVSSPCTTVSFVRLRSENGVTRLHQLAFPGRAAVKRSAPRRHAPAPARFPGRAAAKRSAPRRRESSPARPATTRKRATAALAASCACLTVARERAQLGSPGARGVARLVQLRLQLHRRSGRPLRGCLRVPLFGIPRGQPASAAAFAAGHRRRPAARPRASAIIVARAVLASSRACSTAGADAIPAGCAEAGVSATSHVAPRHTAVPAPSRRSGTSLISTTRPADSAVRDVVGEMGIAALADAIDRCHHLGAVVRGCDAHRTWCRSDCRDARRRRAEGRERWPRESSLSFVVTVRLTGADSMIRRSRVSVAFGAAGGGIPALATPEGWARAPGSREMAIFYA